MSFVLDGSGVVGLSKAEATYELPPEPEPEPELGQEEEKKEEATKDEGKKEGAAGAEGEEKKDGEGEEKKEGEEGKAEEKKDAKDAKADKADKKKKEKKPKKPKKKDLTVRRTLLVSESHHAVSPPSWPPAAIAESKARLRALQVRLHTAQPLPHRAPSPPLPPLSAGAAGGGRRAQGAGSGVERLGGVHIQGEPHGGG